MPGPPINVSCLRPPFLESIFDVIVISFPTLFYLALKLCSFILLQSCLALLYWFWNIAKFCEIEQLQIIFWLSVHKTGSHFFWPFQWCLFTKSAFLIVHWTVSDKILSIKYRGFYENLGWLNRYQGTKPWLSMIGPFIMASFFRNFSKATFWADWHRETCIIDGDRDHSHILFHKALAAMTRCSRLDIDRGLLTVVSLHLCSRVVWKLRENWGMITSPGWQRVANRFFGGQ